MQRSRFPLVAACAVALLTSIPLTASAATPRERYQATYERVDRHNAGPYEHGVAGRNLADDGLESGKDASAEQLRAGVQVMLRMLRPPVVKPVVVDAPESSTPPAPVASVPPTSASSGCTGMEAESGTAGYSAYNPSSGATGCYQIIPSTAAAYDCDLSTPAGQDSCAAAICAGQGSGAWSSSGANPC